MNLSKFNLIWTAIWFTFITVLCLIFQNGWSLFLLIIWGAGIYTISEE